MACCVTFLNLLVFYMQPFEPGDNMKATIELISSGPLEAGRMNTRYGIEVIECCIIYEMSHKYFLIIFSFCRINY